MRWILIVLLVVAVAAGWAVWSRIDSQHQQALLLQAAVCSGTVTAGQLEDSAKAAVHQSHISIAEARRDVESLACPSMADQ
jgi:predicted negative regulator of RcsB-dependent stress response